MQKESIIENSKTVNIFSARELRNAITKRVQNRTDSFNNNIDYICSFKYFKSNKILFIFITKMNFFLNLFVNLLKKLRTYWVV